MPKFFSTCFNTNTISHKKVFLVNASKSLIVYSIETEVILHDYFILKYYNDRSLINKKFYCYVWHPFTDTKRFDILKPIKKTS